MNNLFYKGIAMLLFCTGCVVFRPAHKADTALPATQVLLAREQRVYPGRPEQAAPYKTLQLTLRWLEPQAPYLFVWKEETSCHPGTFKIKPSDSVIVFISTANTTAANPDFSDSAIQHTLFFRTQDGAWKRISPQKIEQVKAMTMP